MGATVIVDAFWGDAGKGKFAAYITNEIKASMAIRAGIGPNAGHSIYKNNKLIKTQMLPLGFIDNDDSLLCIGSGVAVDPDILIKEISKYNLCDRVFVDYRCPIIEKKHLAREAKCKSMNYIDSTKSGGGAARADYVLRKAKRAEQINVLLPYMADVAVLANKYAFNKHIVIEGSQATHLSLFLSKRYPFTTSDNCITSSYIDDVGLNWQYIEKVIMLVKCIPTAVGNGPLPNEMSREKIIKRNLMEYGVNTGREKRRVNEIDYELLKYSVMLNGPTEIALTFCDQYDDKIENITDKRKVTKKINILKDKIESETNVKVAYLETGKDYLSIINLNS